MAPDSPAPAPLPDAVPSWRSHKIVRAAKITEVTTLAHMPDSGGVLTLEGVDGPIAVSPAYVAKHQPQVGGYYVRYADGYESWSPAEAFEGGYTQLSARPIQTVRTTEKRACPSCVARGFTATNCLCGGAGFTTAETVTVTEGP